MYPKGALAPQVLGFVGGERYLGMEGIELEYDSTLSGKPGQTQVVRDLSGNRLSTISTTPAAPGSAVNLTIDSEIQFEAEKALADAVKEFKAKRGCALVMDPRDRRDTGHGEHSQLQPDRLRLPGPLYGRHAQLDRHRPVRAGIDL